MGNPNKLGNGNSGDSSLINDWKDIGDLIDFAPANNNVEPSKSSKIDIVDDVDDDFEEVDLDGAAKNTLGQEPVIVVGQDDLSGNRFSDRLLSSLNRANEYYRDERINKANNAGNKDDTKIDIVDDNDDLDGAPVVGQPNKPSDSKDTAKDDIEDDVDKDVDNSPERVDTTGNKVRSIMDRFKKTGIGKLFVKGCLVVALVGAIGAAHHNGYNSGAANATAKMESKINEMEAKINSINESQLGSDAATKELDGTATTSNAENDAEKLNTNVDVRYIDGETFAGVNHEFGGDNTGADLLDNKNIESTHADPLTNKLAKWVDNEGNVFEAGQANPEAKAAFDLEVINEINRRVGNIGPLVQEGYVLGFFGEGDNINNANMTQTGYEFSTDSNEYQSKKGSIQAEYIRRAGEKTYKIGLLRKGQHYASIGAKEIVNPDGTARPNFFHDEDVDASINGTMYLEEFDTAKGINYYDAHPEVKERVLRVLHLIEAGASEDQIQDAMNSWTIIRLPGCMQYGAIRKTPEPTYTAEYKTPEKSSSTSDREKVIIDEVTPNPDEKPSPEDNTTVTTENKITTGTRHIYRSTHGSHNHDRITPQGKENEKPKDNETPKDNPGENPGETPKDTPGENPKDNEKVLEAKTADVKGADEFDTQKANTVTDQTVETTLGSEQENARMEVSGAEVGNKTVEEKEVVEEFSKKDESGIENTDKTLDQVENNESLNTGTSEKQSDAEAKMTVEEAKESTEKAPDTSYDLDYASAEWDFSNFGN